jgi:hypothetical protein
MGLLEVLEQPERLDQLDLLEAMVNQGLLDLRET